MAKASKRAHKSKAMSLKLFEDTSIYGKSLQFKTWVIKAKQLCPVLWSNAILIPSELKIGRVTRQTTADTQQAAASHCFTSLPTTVVFVEGKPPLWFGNTSSWLLIQPDKNFIGKLQTAKGSTDHDVKPSQPQHYRPCMHARCGQPLEITLSCQYTGGRPLILFTQLTGQKTGCKFTIPDPLNSLCQAQVVLVF